MSAGKPHALPKRRPDGDLFRCGCSSAISLTQSLPTVQVNIASVTMGTFELHHHGSESLSPATSLIAVRRRHYYATMQEKLQRVGQLLLIVIGMTSALIPLGLAALFLHAVAEPGPAWAIAVSVVLLQLIGVLWVAPQTNEVTGAPYQRYWDGLPVGNWFVRRINLRLLLEADAVLAFLWCAAGMLSVTRVFVAPRQAQYALGVGALAAWVVAAQYLWLWGRARWSSLAVLVFMDAALVAVLYLSRDIRAACPAVSALIFVAAFVAMVLAPTVEAGLGARLHPTFMVWRRRGLNRQFDLADPAPRITPVWKFLRVLRYFYWPAFVYGIRGACLLRTAAAVALCMLGALLFLRNAPSTLGKIFWFGGAVLAVNVVVGLSHALADLHGNAWRYWGALPVSRTALQVAEGAVLAGAGMCIVGLFAVAGGIFVAPPYGLFLLAIPMALLAGVSQLVLGVHFPRFMIPLTLLSDVSWVALFTWLARL